MGAHVNSLPNDQNALLAASQSHLDRRKKLKLLTHAGANVNATINPDKRTLLTLAILNLDESFARFLIEHGADINRRDSQGHTPLNIALATGQHGLANFLRTSGARAEPTSRPGLTPGYRE